MPSPGSQRDIPTQVRKELKEITSKPAIAVGLLLFLILLCTVPAFFFLLIPTVIFLVVLYKIGEGSTAKAKKIARSRLPVASSKLEVFESVGLASCVALNDWGIVFVSPNKPVVEMAWNEIASVAEVASSVLLFKCEVKELPLDLSTSRYFLITDKVHEKLPGKVDFDVDPVSGQSKILQRLTVGPRVFVHNNKSLILDDNGIEFNGQQINWTDVNVVTETFVDGDDGPAYHSLTFSSNTKKFEITQSKFPAEDDLSKMRNFLLLKQIVGEKIPAKTQFTSSALSMRDRAIDEFLRGREAAKVGLAFALKSGKFEPLKEWYEPMLSIADKYDLDDHPAVQDFIQDYVVYLERTDRSTEAQRMNRRLHQTRE
ncbi:MAG: hypothetical protein K2X93_15800 [Candidatus Obscuribacterales bacterium]|nr:hypothetical protein [Candidatus Obscuribacterales bacterium]